MTHHLSTTLGPAMQECIERCSDCHDLCTETVRHCLEHAAAEHIVALLDCAQLCDASRDFMLRRSAAHADVCGVCADACERCAESCESLDGSDEVLRRCAEECRRCAESCREMAGSS